MQMAMSCFGLICVYNTINVAIMHTFHIYIKVIYMKANYILYV